MMKTDLGLARKGFSDADRFLKWFQASFYGAGFQGTLDLGSVAPPLDGVWAIAPCLHNRSVSTLAILLESRTLPIGRSFDRQGMCCRLTIRPGWGGPTGPSMRARPAP
jgi:hypothetical protein